MTRSEGPGIRGTKTILGNRKYINLGNQNFDIREHIDLFQGKKGTCTNVEIQSLFSFFMMYSPPI